MGASITFELDHPFQDVEALVPVVAVRSRPGSFDTLLQGHAVALRQHSDSRAQHVQGRFVLIWLQNKV